MRTLTTAINEGEHILRPEGHKATRYALAPGEAMILGVVRAGRPTYADVERKVTIITPAMAKRAEYLYVLCWLENRTVAEFEIDGLVVAQPVRDDPKPRRKRDRSEEDSAGEGPGVAAQPVDRHGAEVRRAQPAPGRRGDLPEVPQEEEPAPVDSRVKVTRTVRVKRPRTLEPL